MKYLDYLDELNSSLTFKTAFKPTQKELDELLIFLIDKKDNEKIWRLAFSFANYDYNFNKFIDYFIKEKNIWYLEELLNALGDDKFDIKQTYKKITDDLFKNEYIDMIKDYYVMNVEDVKKFLNE
jgi:hypothetical protein